MQTGDVQHVAVGPQMICLTEPTAICGPGAVLRGGKQVAGALNQPSQPRSTQLIYELLPEYHAYPQHEPQGECSVPREESQPSVLSTDVPVAHVS